MQSAADAGTLATIFTTHIAAYGLTTLTGEVRKDGKQVANSHLKWGSVSQADWIRHLSGEQRIGLTPVNEDGMCMWGVIDIDHSEHTPAQFAKTIGREGFPLVPFYSKSKALHLYIFFAHAVPMSQTRSLLQEWVRMLALPKNTETFPKQGDPRTISQGTFYSWINMPLFNFDSPDAACKMIQPNGTACVDIDIIFDTIKKNTYTLANHNVRLKNVPYLDAPPCIQAGLLYRDIAPGNRNNWLLSAGVYLRMENEDADISDQLRDINASMEEPIDAERLENTVIKGLQKKTYFYLCNVMSDCNKEECSKREKGIGSKDSTRFEFGQIEQWLENPPYYTWTVNGKVLKFFDEADILNQNVFRKLAYRHLQIMPQRVKDSRWTTIVNRASTDHIIHSREESLKNGFGVGAQLHQLLVDFFWDRKPAQTKMQALLGTVFNDQTLFWFIPGALLSFLKNQHQFKAMKDIEIQAVLEDMGAKPNGRFWTLPTLSLPRPEEIVLDINYRDKEQEGDVY